eukprot:CAMPEP_0204398888 /NCGR_PEP_ID=MMETSP0470-20130426/3093_1 /ASSEMBLY_ACC=CAM_ASM_000385 /TAXON_ID=2969 /ORGANISM="Oxyrrhis marina" /LENGTH=137 /DNA_ID=CAMNT_0051393565 /DNA_START=233 /DNA_END=643 /DNA_ORIENTATION=-
MTMDDLRLPWAHHRIDSAFAMENPTPVAIPDIMDPARPDIMPPPREGAAAGGAAAGAAAGGGACRAALNNSLQTPVLLYWAGLTALLDSENHGKHLGVEECFGEGADLLGAEDRPPPPRPPRGMPLLTSGTAPQLLE